jgi:hypothetical protein
MFLNISAFQLVTPAPQIAALKKRAANKNADIAIKHIPAPLRDILPPLRPYQKKFDGSLRSRHLLPAA